MAWIKFIVWLFVLMIVAGDFAASQNSSAELLWPPPPQQARIKHLQTISSVNDVSEEPGFFSRILAFVFGGNQTVRWLVQPVAIALSPEGKLYIGDPGIHGIHILDLNEKEHSVISETGAGSFMSPVGLAFGNDGSLYVSDSELGKIIVFDEDLDVQFQINDHLVRPAGLQVIGDKLYVADVGQNKIVVFDLKGRFVFEFGRRGSGAGEFNYPVHLCSGTSLAVVDAMNFRIQNFDFAGKYLSSFGQIGNKAGCFANPKSAALDSDGNLYVTDAVLDNFQIFGSDGQLLLVVGGQGSADGEFMSPSGIVVDGTDKVYIVDSLNKRIQIFQYIK